MSLFGTKRAKCLFVCVSVRLCTTEGEVKERKSTSDRVSRSDPELILTKSATLRPNKTVENRAVNFDENNEEKNTNVTRHTKKQLARAGSALSQLCARGSGVLSSATGRREGKFLGNGGTSANKEFSKTTANIQ